MKYCEECKKEFLTDENNCPQCGEIIEEIIDIDIDTTVNQYN